MANTGKRKTQYQRAYMACNTWLRRIKPHLTPQLDSWGNVRVRMVVSLTWGDTSGKGPVMNLKGGEVYNLPWNRAARLLVGFFAELASGAVAEPTGEEADTPAQNLIAQMHDARRFADILERAAKQTTQGGSSRA